MNDDDRFAEMQPPWNDGPPPDRAFLDKLRTESLQAFEAAAPGITPKSTRLGMKAIFSTLALAAAVLVAFGIFRTLSDDKAPSLAQVLQQTENAELNLSVTRNGRTEEIWVAPKRLRWEQSPERYLIVQDNATYRIDETKNRVSAGVGDYFGKDGVNLFELLSLMRPSQEALNAAKAERNADAALVYRVSSTLRDGMPCNVELESDGTSLISVRVTSAGREISRASVLKQQVPAEKFAVKGTLSEDGRVGKFGEVQGLVSRKAVLGSRWLPAQPNLLLMPGDWVRADVRGANAATIKLMPQAELILGPGALVEVIKPDRIVLHEGEAEIVPAKGTPIELSGPGQAKLAVSERGFYRVMKETVAKIDNEPTWLKGFKGATANESLGSLVAMVDGRSTNLSVGIHKVTVDIRDQIARTTIEETFVNHTGSQLEGVFYFPLPQDASISGFAMWIGDQMVEADVVEKQRAREIYEEILREKRDPGLLEWNGGNIFKARVWPIFAHSEKRIRITYTQVLPLQGNAYRYSYALQSDMLKTTPLKELSVDVKVSSEKAIKTITCPTHSVRQAKTEHAGQVEFAAQQYTPTRDFEVAVELADNAAPVTVIPHRRGTDGYFLVQLATPAVDPDQAKNDEPVNLLFLCDTSASIDPQQRAAQWAITANMLQALTPKDTFNLAVCDVLTIWTFEKPQAATPANIAKARELLEKRVSLGWTDLDSMMTSVLKQCATNTQVLYLGDGVPTTRDANPQACAERIKNAYKIAGNGATFHAVALGSTFETVVLKAMASLGGGSMRRLTSEAGPSVISSELLDEITRPPVRDLRVEFRGFETAKVYPETLGNLAPGMQQIMLGRYKPGPAVNGEVVVTGVQAGKPFRTTSTVALPAADAGNSFLPRLWARMHLDKLLEQTQTPAVKDDVIALSEEFGIITPYTSFLVLESDADRERFGVKRRFQMRDGEQYFAKGRDNAEYELAREQMKNAGLWRAGLRQSVLRLLGGMGREMQRLEWQDYEGEFVVSSLGTASSTSPSDFQTLGGFGGGYDRYWYAGTKLYALEGNHRDDLDVAGRAGDKAWDSDADTPGEPMLMLEAFVRDEKLGKKLSDDEYEYSTNGKLNNHFYSMTDGLIRSVQLEDMPSLGQPVELGYRYARSRGTRPYAGKGKYRVMPQRWFDGLFPHLPAVEKPRAVPPSDWPAEARELAKLIARRDDLAKDRGLKLNRQMETFEARDNRLSSREIRKEFFSQSAWAIRSRYDGGPASVEWCDGTERGAFGTAYRLGRLRASAAQDLKNTPLVLDDGFESLEVSYYNLKASVEEKDGRTVLVLRQDAPRYEARYTIDREKRVLVRVEHLYDGKLSSATVYSDFTQAGGLWWAKTGLTTDEKGRVTLKLSQTVEELNAEAFAAQMKAELQDRESVIFLRSPMPTLAAARKAVAANIATVDDRFVLFNHYASFQQWVKAGEELDAIEKLTPGKDGSRWLRTVFLQASRRGEDLRTRLLNEAAKLSPEPGDRITQAEFLFQQGSAVLAANEQEALLTVLKPAYEAQPPHTGKMKQWKQHLVSVLQRRGDRGEELQKLQKVLADEYPRDYSLQVHYAQALYQAGDRDAAFAHIASKLVNSAEWNRWEEDELRAQAANWLEQEGRQAELSAYLAVWTERNPESYTAYARLLTSLLRTGEQTKAEALILKWLKEAQIDGEITPAMKARLQAAFYAACGRGWNMNTDRTEPKWLAAAADAVHYFAFHPKHYRMLDTIGQWQFMNTPAGVKYKQLLFEKVAAEAATMEAERLGYLLSQLLHQYPSETKERWTKLAGTLRERWRNADKPAWKHQLGAQLAQLLAGHVGLKESLAFLREQWKNGPAEHRVSYAQQLFDALINATWSMETEAEALEMLMNLGDADDAAARLRAQAVSLHHLTDRMIAAREGALKGELKDAEKLMRKELAKKHEEYAFKARKEYAQVLKMAAWPEALKPWADAERLWLLARTDAAAAPLAGEVWAYLGDKPKARPQVDEATPLQILEEAVADRYLAMALYFATKKGAAPDQIERTLKYLDAGIAASTDADWKSAKYQLLVALDRPKDLESALNEWIKAEESEPRWKSALGYILAEQGNWKDAIPLFEALQKSSELGFSGTLTLANWYLAANRKDDHEKALTDAWKLVDENTLSRLLHAKLGPWHRPNGPLPTELDKDVLRAFAAVFGKSNNPQNYLQLLQQYYSACRDFRLLAVMADSVIGQSAGKVYPFLEGMQPVLTELRDEAAADELIAKIEALRTSAKTVVDQRALDLLEMQVRRRAAEMINQPGPQAEFALAAMKRAFARPTIEGETIPLSNMLRNFGVISRADLAEEQRRELKQLATDAKPGSYERLYLADNYSRILRDYNQAREALELIRSALDEYTAARDGLLTSDANFAVPTLIGLHESLNEHAKAERYLQTHIQKPANRGQKLWLETQLNDLYQHTLSSGGAVSLGQGDALYHAIEQRLLKMAAIADSNQRYQVIHTLLNVYRTAKDKQYPGVAADITAFASKALPGLARDQFTHYDNYIRETAEAIRYVVSPEQAIAFLLDRIDDEPAWLRWNNQTLWQRHGDRLSYWRIETKQLPKDVEERLLALVLRELRQDLRNRQRHSHYFYYANGNHYWSEKEADFARVAEEVYAEVKDSGGAVMYIAQYLFYGCHRHDRAISMLLDAHDRKLLGDDGQIQLVQMLHSRDRYGQSIAILVPLVERRPEVLHYRLLLCTAYAHTGKQAELNAAFAAAEARWRMKPNWEESAMAALADSAVNCRLYERAVAIYGELIPLRQRSGQSQNDGTLSTYYKRLAQAYSAMAKPIEALDAASGAIVAWGPNVNGRRDALQTLNDILLNAENLDPIAAHLDKQMAETKLINPIVRKALGKAYLARMKYANALAQLQLALEGQANDAETLDLIIDCYDKSHNPDGAVNQMIAALQLNRRDLTRYRKLGEKLQGLNRSAEAERAFSSLVEVLPNESEGHQMLAEIRQTQNRWTDAISHWEQVAAIRALEPTGLLGLAAAQVHEKQWDAATATLKKLNARGWLPRFNEEMKKLETIEKQLPKK